MMMSKTLEPFKLSTTYAELLAGAVKGYTELDQCGLELLIEELPGYHLKYPISILVTGVYVSYDGQTMILAYEHNCTGMQCSVGLAKDDPPAALFGWITPDKTIAQIVERWVVLDMLHALEHTNKTRMDYSYKHWALYLTYKDKLEKLETVL